MVEVAVTPDNEQTVHKLRRALRLKRENFDDWQIGVMPDHRIVLFERSVRPTRCVKCAIVRRDWYRLHVATPVEPLPEEEALRLLRKMLRDFDWDSLPEPE